MFRGLICIFDKNACVREKVMRHIVLFGFSLLLFTATPYAMVSSDGNDSGVHHTNAGAAPIDISFIWDRTGSMNGGTATYLGYYGGSYWALTANHVANSSITFDIGTYNVLDSQTIANPANFPTSDSHTPYTDLKLLRISGDANLQGLGNLLLNNNPGRLTDSSDLYAIGTGNATTVGGTVNVGSRSKQWALFNFDAEYVSAIEFPNTSGNFYAGVFLEEILDTSNENSFQAALYDSGGGVFMNENGEWYLTAIMNAIGSDDNIVSDGDTTYMLNISYYADQINAMMGAIPEPSTYTFLFTVLALIFRFTQRRRKRI